MKNCFLKTSFEDFPSFSKYDRKLILNLPKSTLKDLFSSNSKRKDTLSRTLNTESDKNLLLIKNLNSSRNGSSLNKNTQRQNLNVTLSMTNKLFTARQTSLSKLKRYKYRKQTVEDEDEQLKQNYCSIKIMINQKQISWKEFKVRISTTNNLMEYLHAKCDKNIVGFKLQPQNAKLELFLTFDNCDATFLNGTTLFVQPINKIKCLEVNINSFQIIKCIGSGGFSKVFLCRFKEDGKFYAIKMIDKKFIFKYKKAKIIMNERNIMQMLSHPFVIQMKFAFETAHSIAFVLQYCPGGEMFSLIKRCKRMSQQMARFYMIQILLALQYVHQEGVIYRDFKPENILLDVNGHIKIADFGLAKPNYYTQKDRAYSFCGSPQYMPPEMILKEGHSLAVDFYCLGAVLYEFITGLPPFYSRDNNEIFEATVNLDITFPSKLKLSSELKDLLKGLLCKDQNYRLGSLFGAKQVLAHPWFGKFSRQAYLKQQIKPPTNFNSINSLALDNDELKQKNQIYVLQARRDQQKQNKIFNLALQKFYYDSRQIQDGIVSKRDLTERNLKKVKSNKTILAGHTTRRESGPFLKKMNINRFNLYRHTTKQTDISTQKIELKFPDKFN